VTKVTAGESLGGPYMGCSYAGISGGGRFRVNRPFSEVTPDGGVLYFLFNGSDLKRMLKDIPPLLREMG
jgi:hypothetical protein